MRWVNIELPLAGVDQYSDAAYVLKGQKLDTAENVRMRAPPKLQARYPMTAYGTTTLDSSTIGTPYQIVGHKKETLLCNATTLYSYDSVSGKWGNKGYLSECHVSRFPCYSEFTGSSPQDAACAINQNIGVIAWSGQGGGVNAVVFDANTDTLLASYVPSGVATALYRPRVIAVGNYIYIITYNGVGTGLSYTRIDVTSGNYTFGATAGFTLTGAASGAVAFDACTWSSTQFLIAYWDSAANKVYVDRIATGTNAVDTTRNDTKTSCTALAVCQASSTLGYVAHCGTGGAATGLAVASFGANLVTTGGPTQLTATTTVFACGLAATSSTRGIAVWEMPTAAGVRAYSRWRDFSSTAVLGGSGDQIWSDVVPVAKPFTYGTTTYGLFVNNSDATRTTLNARQETTYYLAQIGTSTEATAGRLMGYACRGLAKPNIYQGYLHSWGVNGTKHDIGVGMLTRFKFAEDDDNDKLMARNALVRTRFDFDPSNLHSSAEWAHGRLFAGACPRWYDGRGVAEHGFPWGPEWAAAAVALVPGTAAQGTYQVASTYEWEDAGGFVARSLPSPYYERTTVPATLGITVTNDHECDLSAKPTTNGISTIRVRHWATVVGATEPLYDSNTVPSLGVSIAYGTLDAIPVTPDTEILYTTGDILDNAPTPPCKVAIRHGDRIFLAGLEDPELVAFSQPFAAGEQPRFNEALTLRFPEAVTALGSMDSTLVVFTRSSVFIVSGDGPPATGGLELGFSVSTISRVIGCDQPRSVLTTPKGVLFLSARGFQLLDRGFSLQWVGAAVIDSTTTYTVCAGSAVDPYHPEAVFWLRNSGSSGIRAVYNYELDQWFTDTLPTNTRGFAGCVVWKESLSKYTLAHVLSDGTIAYDFQAYPPVEGSDYIDTQIITPWIALNTVQGWQRVRKLLMLCDFTGLTSGVTLTVQVGYDYDSAWFETHTRTGTQLEALGKPAYGYITCPPGSALIDGETFTIWDGSVSTVFEFDNTAAVTPPNVAVDFTALDTAKTVRNSIVSVINNAGLGVSAYHVSNNRVLVQNATAGTAGNGACSDTVADPGFVIDNMSYGCAVDQVEIHLARQECEAVRFRIRITGTADDTGNVDYRSLVIEAGLQPGAMKLNADTARD